ncbi:rhamnosyltransferase [Vibrio crassostreae]|uniref:Uncharacterized protein n=2 Tax=Vibrio crassostreae TaxID=246167 RepID=A0A822N052_9VIBR|nr:rhamnosyltransferase [Vibrio crassostreae]TCT62643.1 rhamnosyltransferase [Vibrio crassostreae]TCT71077.1 rhamnosyltransferase [Vibrio crassostreae]TCT83403.1 rhamnosyltransferase [Vibrio crassostreae]TCU03814.1 rhamnosyltransferase [Vibrio crassostreae]
MVMSLMNTCVFICRYKFSLEEILENFANFSTGYSYFIFDNSEIPLSDDEKEILERADDAVYYYSFSDNLGLAYALNYLNKVAIEKDFTHAIYFDQDSKIDSELIKGLSESFFDNSKDLFCIGPKPVTYDHEDYYVRYSGKVDGAVDIYNAKELITSGMLYSLEISNHIGGFDEKLFLDMVDFEICWRARNKGYNVIVDKKVIMQHQVGENAFNFFGRKLPISAPIRNYYQTRNNLYLLINSDSPLPYKLYMFSRRLVNIIINLIFVGNKKERLVYNLKGIKDAIRKNMGKYRS